MVARSSSPPTFRPALRAGLRRLTLVGAALAACTLAQAASTADLKRLSMEDLMDLDVTSVSKRPEKLSAAPSAIQVVTGEDVRRSGAMTLPEALRLASNLEVAQIDSRQWAIAARGFNNTTTNKLLVLVDGRTIYTPLYAGVFWDAQALMLDDLDQIEVISGPGATQWGANAVNGVINVTTKSARDTHGSLVSAGAGTELRRYAAARFGDGHGNLHYRIYGKSVKRDDSVLPDGTTARDAWQRDMAGFRADWGSDAGPTLTVQGDYYDGTIEQPAFPDIVIRGANLLARWEHVVSPDSNYKLQAYFDRTHRMIPGSFTEDLDVYDLDFQHHWRLGEAHNLVWGLGWRTIDDETTGPPTFVFLPAAVQREWFNVFAEDQFVLLPDRLHATVGAKLEHNEYTGYEFQPSVRASWKIDADRTLWGAISRAMRTPSRVDRELFASNATTILLEGGPNFRSEELIAYELGFRHRVSPRVMWSLATYYHDYDKLRSLEPIAPPAPYPVVIANGLEGRSYGAELTLDWRASDRWRYQLGYSERRVRSWPKPGSFDRTSTRSQALDPDRQGLLRVWCTPASAWEIDATLRYVSAIEYQTVPGYTELDLRVGWRPAADWEISVVGQNLLDRQHAEFGTASSRREIQRGVYGKVTWRH